MNRRTTILLISALILVLGLSTITGTLLISTVEDESALLPKVESVTAANGDEIGPLTMDINRNPGMEEVNSYGAPNDYNYYTSGHGWGDAVYQDLTYAGAYAGYIESQGMTSSSTSYLTQNIGNVPRPYLVDDISIDLYFYLKDIPDLDRGSSCHILLQTFDGDTYRTIYYVLSYDTYARTNQSTTVWYFMNHTAQSWHNFIRNVTADYEAYSSFGAAGVTRYVTDIQVIVESPYDSQTVTSLVIDDVSVKNGTSYEFVTDPDFEMGNGVYWGAFQRSPGYISQSTDATEGTYSANMSLKSIGSNADGYVNFYRSYSYPMGVYPSTPITFTFDWKYSDSLVADTNQWGRLRMRFRNDSGSYYAHYYLGIYNDDFSSLSNSTTYHYVQSPNYGVRDTWHQEVLDVSALAKAAGFATDTTLYDIRFQINLGFVSTAQVELLIDDFNIITYPAGDPGFEEDWDDELYQFSSWDMWNGELGVISRTSDSHSGSSALNLTVEDSDWAGVYRSNMDLQLNPSVYTDFWWRLDEVVGIDREAFIRFYFDGPYYLSYFFAYSDMLPGNTSNSAFYPVDNINVTGSWFNVRRNITDDMNAVFGPHDWNITMIVIDSYAGPSTKISIILDDINFIDAGPPVISDVQRQTAIPVYYEPVEIGIDTYDELTGVYNVQVFYNAGSGWEVVEAGWMIDDYYEAEIPMLPYGTIVEYYVNVTDYSGTFAIDDNGGLYYSYTVTDDINPTVTLDAPYEDQIITGNMLLEATADDIGSGVDHVDFIVDAAVVFTDYAAPFEFDWDSRTIANGTHTITAEAFDDVGNSIADSTTIDVQNDVAPPVLSRIQVYPEVPGVGDTVRLSIAVWDASGVDNVTLYYRVEGGMWNQVVMASSGGLYFADIPATDTIAAVDYYIVAFDTFEQSSNQGTALAPLGYQVTDVTGELSPPEISDVYINPSEPTDADTVTVYAAVTDVNGVENVTLYYQIGRGIWMAQSMTSSGSLYSASIPSAMKGLEVKYYIVAFDTFGLNATSGSVSNPYSYVVTGDLDGPVISDLLINPAQPVFRMSVAVMVSVTDATGVDVVTLHYKIGTADWEAIQMANTGTLYYEDIPGAEYGVTVQYYITALDTLSYGSSMGSEESPFSYVVDDDTPPTMSVSGPPVGSIVAGIVDFTVTAADEGSGIINISLSLRDTNVTLGFEPVDTTSRLFTWDTAAKGNGVYTVSFIAFDGVGYYAEVELEYEVHNPVGFEGIVSSLTDFMTSYGFFVGFATMAVLYVGVTIFLKRRATKVAA
ncbi:MAG: Ig-like domain-containing protein [Candidatus Thorarchaeota archaeon]